MQFSLKFNITDQLKHNLFLQDSSNLRLIKFNRNFEHLVRIVEIFHPNDRFYLILSTNILINLRSGLFAYRYLRFSGNLINHFELPSSIRLICIVFTISKINSNLIFRNISDNICIDRQLLPICIKCL